MFLSLDLVTMAPGATTAAFWRTRSRVKNTRGAALVKTVYLARFTTLPGPVPSFVSFGMLGIWPDRGALDEFRATAPWGRGAREHAGLTLAPYKVRGTWDGITPAAEARSEPTPTGPVLAITRARTAGAYHPATWRANPAIVRALRANTDVLWSTPFADRAFGVIGTFSLWPSDEDLVRFAYGKDDAHAPVIGAANRNRWLPESWFARAGVLDSFGHWPSLERGT